MKPQRITHRAAQISILVAILLLLSACKPSDIATSSQEFLIKTYAVEGYDTEQLAGVLGSALRISDEQRFGQVRALGQSQILVSATQRVHDDIEVMLQRLPKELFQDQKTAISYSFWKLAIIPGEVGGVPDELTVISDAVNALSHELGGTPHRFVLQDFMQLESMEDARSSIRNHDFMINVRSAVQGERISAEVNIGEPNSHRSLEFEVELHNGRDVVIGVLKDKTSEQDALVAYVLRASLP